MEIDKIKLKIYVKIYDCSVQCLQNVWGHFVDNQAKDALENI